MNGRIVVVDDNEHRISNQDVHYKMRAIWNAKLLTVRANGVIDRQVSISYRSTFQHALASELDWIALVSVYTATSSVVALHREIDDLITNNPNVPVFGHIINKPDVNELKLATHMVIVNLSAMRRKMSWVNTQYFFGLGTVWADKIVIPGFKASEECIHDNYTPIQMKPDNTALSTTVKSQFGTNVIAGCLLADCEVLNIPNNIRYMYAYAYPEKWTRFDHIYHGGQDASDWVCEAYCRKLADK